MKLTDNDARRLGQIIHDACRATPWTDDTIADKATELLPRTLPAGSIVATQYVTHLRGVPREPLRYEITRCRLAAVVDVLGLDRAEISWLAGGI